MDPTLQNKIRQLVEDGLSADELLKQLHEQAEQQLLDEEEGAKEELPIPNEIKLIAQAMAYRRATIDDLDELHKLLNQAYKEEIQGSEAFRMDKEAISKESVEQHLQDSTFKWLLAEAPQGHGIERDGALLGACCFSTDGISRRNGIVEGNVASIRFLGILPRYRGLCIGRRLLQKVETVSFKGNCIRVVVSIPSPRDSMLQWITERDYVDVRDIPYPFEALGQVVAPHLDAEEIFLIQFVKTNPTFLKKPEGESLPVPTPPPSATANASKPRIPLPPHWRQHMVMSEPLLSEEILQTSNQDEQSTEVKTEQSAEAVEVDVGVD